MNALKSGSFLVLVFLASIVSGEEGSIDLPSTGAEAAQFYLANQAGRDVIFYLQTESLDKTEMQLKAGESKLYSGKPGETWMNIFIYTEGQSPVERFMEPGKKYCLQSTSSGGIDMFFLSPR